MAQWWRRDNAVIVQGCRGRDSAVMAQAQINSQGCRKQSCYYVRQGEITQEEAKKESPIESDAWWRDGAVMAQATNMSRVRLPDPLSYVGWVSCWFSTLLWEVFLSGYLKRFFFECLKAIGFALTTLRDCLKKVSQFFILVLSSATSFTSLARNQICLAISGETKTSLDAYAHISGALPQHLSNL